MVGSLSVNYLPSIKSYEIFAYHIYNKDGP